jgi:hypothetical protein
VDELSRIVSTPTGDEFVVEAWKPGFDGFELHSLVLWAWSIVSPGWRISVKRLPGARPVHRERVRARDEMLARMDKLAASIERTGRVV